MTLDISGHDLLILQEERHKRQVQEISEARTAVTQAASKQRESTLKLDSNHREWLRPGSSADDGRSKWKGNNSSDEQHQTRILAGIK